MKKILSVVLVVLILCSFATVAFADETGVGLGSYQTDVIGTYVEGTVGNGIVYSVDIAWSEMNFTYHSEKAPVWDVETHTYSEAVPAYWEGEGSITVTNHSNAYIKATPSYTAESGCDDARMVFDASVIYLSSAANGYEAKTGIISVAPSGSLPENINAEKIGTISINLAAYEFDMSRDEIKSEIDRFRVVCNAMMTDYDINTTEQVARLVECQTLIADETVADSVIYDKFVVIQTEQEKLMMQTVNK